MVVVKEEREWRIDYILRVLRELWVRILPRTLMFLWSFRLSPSNVLAIRPVALEGEGSNCFSITQLVGQKRQ